VLLRPKGQVTIPRATREEGGVAAGDRLRVRPDGRGRIVFERVEQAAGMAAGETPA
jgi:bifunctional DNA-binding transcriptional regulator/antitoxin component of YhaV-PrlF toxin-antitoxin module